MLFFKALTYVCSDRYGDIFQKAEYDFSAYSLNYADTKQLARHFEDLEKENTALLAKNIVLAAYEQCIKANHIFNLLESRRTISVTERAAYIARIRTMVKSCCNAWLEIKKVSQ